jgi:type IV secretion system protein VirB10
MKNPRIMRASLLAALAFAFALASISAPAAEIPAGRHLLLRMQNSINTRTAGEGDYVYLLTAAPLSADGAIAVPAGSYVQGVVVFAERPGRISGRGQLAIRIETITLPGGQLLEFNQTPRVATVESGDSGKEVIDEDNTIQQGSNTGSDARQIAIMAGRGAAIGGFADRSFRGAGIGAGIGSAVGFAATLVTRGRDLELRQGDTLDIVFDQPVSLD